MIARAALVVAAALLAGCGLMADRDVPVYVTSALPAIPEDCEAACPAEPRLKPGEDVDDIRSAANRSELKKAYRCERQKRAACVAQLRVLLPRQ